MDTGPDNGSDSVDIIIMESEASISPLIDDETSNTSLDNKLFGVDGTETKPNTSRKSTGCIQNMGRNTPSSFNPKPKVVTMEDLKFMQNFDPQTSSRNQQKKKKAIPS